MQIKAGMLERCQLLEADALEWWKASSKAGVSGAVKYLSNDDTGTLIVVTRGEYAEEIKAFIESLE